MNLPIEIGRTYANGYGERHRIMGRTKPRPDLYWSNCGEWFDEQGRAMRYDPKSGEHTLYSMPNWRDLHKEVD